LIGWGRRGEVKLRDGREVGIFDGESFGVGDVGI
jgi:hypothetical protein